MSAVGDALTGAASPLLAPGRAGQLDYEGEDEEFGLLLAETMASFGTGHLAALAPEKKILFLQQASSSTVILMPQIRAAPPQTGLARVALALDMPLIDGAICMQKFTHLYLFVGEQHCDPHTIIYLYRVDVYVVGPQAACPDLQASFTVRSCT